MKELLDNLELLNNGDIGALEKQIPDAPYRRNFIALAEKLAPDGKDIRTVGFTSVTGKETRKVALAIHVKCCASESTEEHATHRKVEG